MYMNWMELLVLGLMGLFGGDSPNRPNFDLGFLALDLGICMF